MILSKRHHNNHRSPRGGLRRFSLHTLERFFLNYGLGFAGALLLILGIIYLVILNAGNDNIFNLIQSFLNPGSEINTSRIDQDFSLRSVFSLNSITFPGTINLIFLYLPGFIPLILISFFTPRKVLLRNSLILIGFMWLIFADGKIFLYNAYSNGIFFKDFISAFNFFLTIQIILVLISLLNKNQLAFNLSVIFFFISIVLIRSYFGGMMPYCIVLIIFQVTVLLFSLRFKWKTPFLMMMIITACYLTFYILRKIVFAGNPQPVSYLLPALIVWFITSVTGLGILKPKFRRKSSSVIWDILSFVCLFLVSAAVSSMVMISGISDVYQLYTALVIIALIILAVLNVRFEFLKSKKTFYSIVCISSAFLIPLLYSSHFFLVLAAALSVAFLFNSHLTRSQISLNLSKVFFFITISLYLLEWGLNIIPGFIDMKYTGEVYSFHFVLSSLLITSALYFYTSLHSYIVKEYPFLSVRTLLSSKIMETFLLLAVYPSCFLVLNYSLILIFPGYQPNIVELAMFIYASVILMFFLKPADSKYTIIISTTVSAVVIVLYPLIINPEAVRYRDLFLKGNNIAIVPFLMHYICLIFISLIIFKLNGFLVKFFHNKSQVRHIFQLIFIFFATFILLTEYDNLSLLWFNRFSDLPLSEILRKGVYLPYSIIILFVSISLLIYSLIHYSRFVRRVSLILIILVLFKIFLWDLKLLSGNSIVILLVSVGLILLTVSLIIRRIGRIRKKRNLIRRGASSEVITLH